MNRWHTRNFNPQVVNDMIKIKDEIKEECQTENPDGKKLTEMEMNYLLKGIQLQNQNIYNNNRKNIPW